MIIEQEEPAFNPVTIKLESIYEVRRMIATLQRGSLTTDKENDMRLAMIDRLQEIAHRTSGV